MSVLSVEDMLTSSFAIWMPFSALLMVPKYVAILSTASQDLMPALLMWPRDATYISSFLSWG